MGIIFLILKNIVKSHKTYTFDGWYVTPSSGPPQSGPFHGAHRFYIELIKNT